jgi:hypothetical protein
MFKSSAADRTQATCARRPKRRCSAGSIWMMTDLPSTMTEAGDTGPVSSAGEIIELARRCQFWRPDIEGLMARLPVSDEELDAALDLLIRTRDKLPFSNLLLATLAAGRAVDARHVEGTVPMVGCNSVLMGWRFFRGDFPGAVFRVVRNRRTRPEWSAILLYCLLRWWDEHGEGPLPPGFVSGARRLARTSRTLWADIDPVDLSAFCTVMGAVDDPGTRELLERGRFPVEEIYEIARKETLARVLDGHPVISLVPETLKKERVLSGFTVKRAVEKRNRNELCHCGSGKKYKRCCAGRDSERLLDSSRVAGVTQEELRNEPEPHLTAERIETMPLWDLFRLNIAKLDPALFPAVVGTLAAKGEVDRAEEVIREINDPDPGRELSLEIANVATACTLADRGDLVRAILTGQPWLRERGFLSHLLAAEEDKGRLFDLLENSARAVLEGTAGDVPEEGFALGLLWSRKAPALSLMIARAVIANPSIAPHRRRSILDAARLVLDWERWNPADVIEEVNERVEKEGVQVPPKKAKPPVTVESWEELRAQKREADRLREELAQAQAALDERQRREDQEAALAAGKRSASAQPPPVPQGPSPEMKALRERCEYLREELKQRHAERNELRRDLDATRESLAALLERAAPSNATGEDYDEESVLQAQTELPNWPPRFPVWPEDVRARRRIPDEVWRSAVALSGRLAAGDPGAVHGVRLLKGLKGVHRQRFSGSWRLLFEVDQNELRVLDIVNRRDLVAWARGME